MTWIRHAGPSIIIDELTAKYFQQIKEANAKAEAEGMLQVLWEEPTSEPARSCTCGASKTYGPNCPVEYHSDWCDLAVKK